MNLIRLISLSIVITLCFSLTGISQPLSDTLVTPNPSIEAQAVFRYLQDMYGKKTLSGQMWAPWGINEKDYVQTTTGKLPAIIGLDYIHQNDNDTENQRAEYYWNQGGLPTIMWHWGAPSVGEGYENSKGTIDIDKCFVEGTEEYNEMWRELRLKADLLEDLRDAGIPVLWRPFHELDGHWFWWSKEGPELFKRLWTTMFDYFVHERKLNNLIWVLCYTAEVKEDWYPGDEYVDIAGADTYDTGNGAHLKMFQDVESVVGKNTMPIAYHECGIIPDPDDCFEKGAMWSWWMEWHTHHLTDIDKEYLRYVYNHELVITLDEVPDIMAEYGWNPGCQPDTISALIRFDEGNWIDTSHVMAEQVDSIHIKVTTGSQGSWIWSGCGVSGSDSIQFISGDNQCAVEANFTNQCGARSTYTFVVAKNTCVPSELKPYFKINEGPWKSGMEIMIDSGSTVALKPQPISGAWSWKGCDTNSYERELIITPDTNCTYIATYTNYCGKESEVAFQVSFLEEDTTTIDDTASTDTSLTRIFVHTVKTNRDFYVYPQPAKDKLNVSLSNIDSFKNYKVSIFSMDGSLLQTQRITSHSTSIDISGIRPGYYIIGKHDEGIIDIQSFIKVE
ncbi:MAG: glycosyl hydrolase [Bacteroidota bacterium]